MLNKRSLKFRCIANFSIFAGIVPIGVSGIVVSSIKNVTDVNTSNKSEFINENTLKFGDKYISLRSNPMNNFVSLTTTKVNTSDVKEQFTYALCDTATSQEGIRYGKNSGIVKLDNEGNVVALWTLPKTGRGQENEYIYTTNIVFGDTEETVYVLCGISNPAAALNSVYGEAVVPTKINYDENANLQDPNTAYVDRCTLLCDRVFPVDVSSKYKVDITNYSFANYPKVKIYKLNANDLTQTAKYDFEFPPAATGKLNDPLTASDEYDKTIIAGFGGGQHLNYWSTNSTWITGYKVSNKTPYVDQLISFMNSSFFHYLQFGQTFDYVGNSQFMMIPTYIGIDPNLGGLYSLVNERMSRSLSSLSSYPSLYNVLYKYKGKPFVNTTAKTVDLNKGTATPTSYQYQYLDGLSRKVDVNSGSEFALKESVINLILLSIGYFLPNYPGNNVNQSSVDMEKIAPTFSGFMLNTYGIIGFSPLKNEVVNKYNLYVFNKDENFGIPVHQFIIKNMFVDKDASGKKRYRFLLWSCNTTPKPFSSEPDYYNADGRDEILFGTKNLNGDNMPLGFTWDEFVSTYDTIQNSQFNALQTNIDLTGVNGNSKDWSDRNANRGYYDNLNSVLTVKDYTDSGNSRVPLGWYAAAHFWNLNGLSSYTMGDMTYEIETSTGVTSNAEKFGMFSNSSGSKYINYGDKILISDPIWLNNLEVITNKNNFPDSAKMNYKKTYNYGDYPNSADSFNKISVLFSFPNNEGFGYLTYNNTLKVCLLDSTNLPNQLALENFKGLPFLENQQSSSFCSAVPVGKTLFTSVINDDKTISNGYFNIGDIKDNNTTMWIIIGISSVAAMFIALGLGIGIPMRKNAKLQLATTKLANKKIDMLSTTVAKSFKKLAENTNTLLKNQPKVLAAATSVKSVKPQQPTRPMNPTSPVRPTGPQQQSTRPMNPTSPTRPTGPQQQSTRPMNPTSPTRPTGPQQPTRSMGSN